MTSFYAQNNSYEEFGAKLDCFTGCSLNSEFFGWFLQVPKVACGHHICSQIEYTYSDSFDF